MNIFLTGYRCTGKTCVGKALAKVLKRPFLDADLELVKEQSMSIKDIVAKKGWDAFRKMEHAVIKRICSLENYVVATGGGVVLSRLNVELMKKSGVVVWLKADPKTIEKRIVEDESTDDFRPALTSKGLVEEIEEVLSERKTFYEEAMDFPVDTDFSDIDEITDTIIGKIDFYDKQ